MYTRVILIDRNMCMRTLWTKLNVYKGKLKTPRQVSHYIKYAYKCTPETLFHGNKNRFSIPKKFSVFRAIHFFFFYCYISVPQKPQLIPGKRSIN